MKKRIIAAIMLIFCMAWQILPIAAEETAEEPAQTVEMVEIEKCNAAVVYNLENDQYIFEMDADKAIFPASTVKLMTAIVAIEALGEDLDRAITVQGGALVGVKGNNIALKHNEVLTVEQLLYALICGCANDAANVLAWEIAGSTEAFVEMMNEKAAEIGAVHTYYTNPTGMHDPRMVTTARDTAIISTYALQLSPLADMASVEKFVIPATNMRQERTVYNKNYYFATNMEYLYIWKIPRGLNAGYTVEGGYCVATSATRDGLTYVVVVMGAESDEKYIYSYTEAADLIKWAFNAYSRTKVLTTADMICEVPVRLAGKVDYVTLFPSENIELFLPNGIDVKSDVQIDWKLDVETFTAPVSEGQIGGHLTVTYNGTKLGTYDLITRNSVNRNNVLYVLDLIAGFMATQGFRTAMMIAGIAIIGYVVVLILVTVNRNRRGNPPRSRNRMR